LVGIAPNLTAAVPKRVVRKRRVRKGLARGWLDDLPPDLGVPAIRELFEVAHRLVDVALHEGVEDAFRWGWEKDYSYSTRSGYRATFGARMKMPHGLQIWRSPGLSAGCRRSMEAQVQIDISGKV
jgi:hypothetical protein